jgi:hypothetical protein
MEAQQKLCIIEITFPHRSSVSLTKWFYCCCDLRNSHSWYIGVTGGRRTESIVGLWSLVTWGWAQFCEISSIVSKVIKGQKYMNGWIDGWMNGLTHRYDTIRLSLWNKESRLRTSMGVPLDFAGMCLLEKVVESWVVFLHRIMCYNGRTIHVLRLNFQFTGNIGLILPLKTLGFSLR